MNEITSKLPGFVAMQSKHTKSYIFHKNFVTGLQVAKNLIEFISNNFEENEKKVPIENVY